MLSLHLPRDDVPKYQSIATGIKAAIDTLQHHSISLPALRNMKVQMNIYIIYYILDNILYKKVKVNMTLKDFSQLTMLNSNIN